MKVAVVGGGLGGLAAARRLANVGIDVTVFEAGSRPHVKVAPPPLYPARLREGGCGRSAL